MENSKRANIDLARKTLPKQLFQALEHLFAQNLSSCVLVGGTALSGFYFGHRRSDDIDLFTEHPAAQTAVILAVKTLVQLGASFSDEFRTAQYFRTTCLLNGHQFTIDVVEDANFFRVGSSQKVAHGIHVADIPTLIKTKSAALVSRCSEKDLYDLLFLLQIVEGLTVGDIIEQGQQIDSGLNGESLLLSISGTKLKESACNFSLDSKRSPGDIHQILCEFQRGLIKDLGRFLKNQPAQPLKDLIGTLRRFTKRG